MAISDWKYANNILCVRLDSAGDVLMTTPAFKALKGPEKQRSLTLLTSSPGADIGKHVPEVDHVIVYDAPWVKNNAEFPDSRKEYRMADQLRQHGFDGAVIFCVFSQNPLPAALLCYLADIPLRLAYCRENPYKLLSDWIPDPEPKQFIRHEVERQLELVKCIGCETGDPRLSLKIPDAAREKTRQVVQALNPYGQRPLVIIHPGATAASRRYAPGKFAAVADGIIESLGAVVFFTGTAPEQDLVHGIRLRMKKPSYSVAGMLDGGELGALISLADLIITNNTAPAHIAAAVGTKIVALYALTNPQHTPWKAEAVVLSHDVPCRNCFKSVCPEKHNNCLRMISPAAVVEAAGRLLNG